MFEKTYYLEPDSRSPKAYVLLRETLAKTDRLAIVQFTLRQKTRLGVLRVHDDVILLQGLLWGDEVRAADFKALDTSVKVSANELKMSSSLVESMSTDFDPDRYTDSYQEELQQLIDAKLEAGDDIDTEKTFGEQADEDDDEGGDVLDLMAALRASVDKKRTGGSGSRSSSTSRSSSGSASGSSDSTKKAPARKTAAAKDGGSKDSASKDAAAKSTAKKAPAKKAPAKKPAAKKQAS
jgi:DNA end-binding protein Ku